MAQVTEDHRMRLAVGELHNACVDVRKAVVVEILNLDVWSFERQRNQADRHGHILELRLPVGVSLVEIQTIGYRLDPGRVVVLSDYNVGQRIAVDIADGDAANHVVSLSGGPREGLVGSDGFLKFARAVIQHQIVAERRCQKEIGPTVAVGVGRGDSQPSGILRNPGLARHVRKLQVAEIPKQPRRSGLRAVVAGRRFLAD